MRKLNNKFSFSLLRAGVVFMAAIPAVSFGAEATTQSSATVIEPIAITKAADLVFGDFAPGEAGGTVTVSTSGGRTASGTILSTAGDTSAAAKFDVTGNADSTYSINTTAPGSLTDSVSTETMVLEIFSDLDAGGITTGNVTAGTLTSGAQSIYMGGKLTVGAAQAAGTYSGDITVTVEYN